MPGVRDGLRVVDFDHHVAGPLLAQLLADKGADVVHVNAPGGQRLSGLPDGHLGRGKRRIMLDLRRPAGFVAARELASRVDVLCEDRRPAVMDRLGLGATEALDGNPHLVSCSLPGWGPMTTLAVLAALEGVIMSATGGYRRLHEHWDWTARTQVPTHDRAGQPRQLATSPGT